MADNNQSNSSGVYYEADIPGVGVVRWPGELPEWVEVPSGHVHRNVFLQWAGVKKWVWTGQAWVLGEK